MKNFKIESSYLKLCYEFRAFILCMKAAFYRPDYQKFLMCLLIKRLGQAFVSKHLFQSMRLELSRAFETLGRVFKAFTWAVQTLSQAFEGLTENL